MIDIDNLINIDPLLFLYRLHDLTSALNVINEATQLGTTIDLNAVSLLNGDQAILGNSP